MFTIIIIIGIIVGFCFYKNNNDITKSIFCGIITIILVFSISMIINAMIILYDTPNIKTETVNIQVQSLGNYKILINNDKILEQDDYFLTDKKSSYKMKIFKKWDNFFVYDFLSEETIIKYYINLKDLK